MRDAKHFKNLINKNPSATINFTLAAAAVYASRYGVCEPEHHQTEEYRDIARNLKSRYGENLTGDETLSEMKSRPNDTISIRIPIDILELIDAQAKIESRTRSNMIIAILREKLK